MCYALRGLHRISITPISILSLTVFWCNASRDAWLQSTTCASGFFFFPLWSMFFLFMPQRVLWRAASYYSLPLLCLYLYFVFCFLVSIYLYFVCFIYIFPGLENFVSHVVFSWNQFCSVGEWSWFVKVWKSNHLKSSSVWRPKSLSFRRVFWLTKISFLLAVSF